MSAYTALINFVTSIVRTNNNEEITGANMQQVLLQMISEVGTLQFKGIAVPTTDPGVTEGQAFYIATENGTYQHFGHVIAQKGLYIFAYDHNEVEWDLFEIPIADRHVRAHNVDSISDHNPAAEADRGKLVYTDPTTGNITFLDPATLMPVEIWVRDTVNGYIHQKNIDDKVGIGTVAPTKELDVDGELRIRTISDSDDSNVLMTDEDGNVHKKDKSYLITNVYAEEHPAFPIETLKLIKEGVTSDITTLIKPNGIVAGGIITWVGDLNFLAEAIAYFIFGTFYTLQSDTLMCDAADPTLDRIDLVCINDTPEFFIKKGVPSENPQQPTPAINEIGITPILIPAGSTIPGGISGDMVYDENVEWVVSSSGVVVDPNSTVSPLHGSKCIDVGTVGNGDTIAFTRDTPVSISDYEVFSLNIKLKSILNKQYKLSVQLLLDATPVSKEVILSFNYNSLDWQHIPLILSSIPPSSSTIDGIRLKWIKTGASVDYQGFYLDFIKLEAGIIPPTINEGWYCDAMTEIGYVRTLIKPGDNVYFQPKSGSRIKLNKFSHITNGNVLEIDFDETGLGTDSAYVYIAYASDANGTGFTMTFNGLLNFIAIKTTTTPIAEPQASDFAGLWKQYAGIAPSIGPHYTYVAWCDTPDPENTLGFTLTANLTLPFEAILITHTEIAEPTAADFVGLWRPRVTTTDVYDKWNLLVDDDETPQQAITDNTTVYLKRGKGIALSGYTDESDRQVVNIEATNELSIPESNAAEGFKVKLIANEAQAVGDVCFINSSGKAQIANATTIATASARLICTQSVGADSEATYLIEGIIKVTGLSLTAGALVYLSVTGTTGNTLTQTAPSTADNVVQILGVALTTDSIFFNPSLSQVEYK